MSKSKRKTNIRLKAAVDVNVGDFMYSDKAGEFVMVKDVKRNPAEYAGVKLIYDYRGMEGYSFIYPEEELVQCWSGPTKSILIGSVEYSIVEEDKILEIEGEKGFIGLCIYEDTTIKLSNKVSHNRKEEVMVHEMLHAIFYESGYEEQDEEMILRVGKTLYGVLKNNPDILGLIQE